MRVPEGKIEKAASKDQSRPALCSAYLKIRGEEAFLEATNSYIAARLPVDSTEDDTEGFIPLEAVLEARKIRAGEIQVTPEMVRVSMGKRAVEWERESYGKWPDFDSLIPEEGETTIAFNVGQLADLAAALGTEVVRLTVTGLYEKIRVEPATKDGSVGVLMPYKVTP